MSEERFEAIPSAGNIPSIGAVRTAQQPMTQRQWLEENHDRLSGRARVDYPDGCAGRRCLRIERNSDSTCEHPLIVAVKPPAPGCLSLCPGVRYAIIVAVRQDGERAASGRVLLRAFDEDNIRICDVEATSFTEADLSDGAWIIRTVLFGEGELVRLPVETRSVLPLLEHTGKPSSVLLCDGFGVYPVITTAQTIRIPHVEEESTATSPPEMLIQEI